MQSLLRSVATIAVLLLCGSGSLWGESGRVTIFVSAPTRDGFVDTGKEIQDSVKDVTHRLSHMKEIQVVKQREGAVIVLTIIARGVGSHAYGRRIEYSEYYGGATLTSAPITANTYWVSAIMQVGSYRKEFTGSYVQTLSSSMGAWTICSEQIGKDLKSWVGANAEQLKQSREAH